ncbi:MAG: peptidoglycan DD-metalloendopeptidase family protein [Ignavibacteriaceae bacterium]
MNTGKNKTIYSRLSNLASVLFLFLLLVTGFIRCSETVTKDSIPQNSEPKLNAFGFCSDSLDKQSYSVQKNETFSEILLNFGVPGDSVIKILDKAKNTFNARKIIPGDNYYTFSKPDSINSLSYFVYEKDPINFIVFDLNDSINVYETSKEVITKVNQISATIDHSLYVSLMQSDASPKLAVKLSQIFAWQIDFYHLQEGDNFKVIYEEKYVDSNLIGIGKINGAYFNHDGKEFYAIPFMQDSTFQYFDENGNSLRKAFLKSPLEFGRITSRFSRSRLHPILKVRRPHLGIDYAAPVGTPVRSTGDGTVISAGYKGGNGRFIKIRHNFVYSTMYMHLSRFAKGLKKGSKVKQGEVIGYVGSSGLSTGPHLDYRFFINDRPVNPLTVELPPSHPVKKELFNQYETVRDSVINIINQIASSFAEKPV